MSNLNTLFPSFSLIPVVVIDDEADAAPLAEALLAGGVSAIEITLRTAAGFKAIEAVAKQVPDIIVGSGTVLNTQQMDDAANAGARFQVSPGITSRLAQHAGSTGVAWLPGVASASDIILALEHGFSHVKCFPASLVGGVPMLKQFSSVFPQVRICPTGGVSQQNMAEYQQLANVFAIGGSWLAPKAAMQAKDWLAITQIAKESLG